MNEQWKDIVGYESYYEVSNLGRIRRHVNSSIVSRTWPGRMLNQFTRTGGYFHVKLYAKGHPRIKSSHSVVMEAFVGQRIKGLQINHIDGDKSNNTIENLEYVTQLENMKHASELGLVAHGESHGSAKLTEGDVVEISHLVSQGFSFVKISKMFNISATHVSDIKRGKYWKHVTRKVWA